MNLGHGKLLVFQNYVLRVLKNKFENLKTQNKAQNCKKHSPTSTLNVDDTIKDIFVTKRSKEEWWDKILSEEKTHLVTKMN